MKDLYDRLGKQGFDASFVKASILPDWWDDKLAAQPSNRALAEASVSKILGYRIQHLHDPNTALPEPAVANFRLKRNKKDVLVADVRPSVYVAERLAKLAVSMLEPQPPQFDASLRPENIRKQILSKSGVDLLSLVNFAWSVGIVVLHVDPERLPKAAKKFAGVAMYCGRTPVIVLASKKDSPPWIAFHLAHECGHIFLGHVKPGDPPLVDADIEKADDDQQEKQADQFANIILTGRSEPSIKSRYRLSGPKLAAAATEYSREHGVNAGTAALVYARTLTDMWPAAQNALKLLGFDSGAHELLGKTLARRLNLDEASETSSRFLSCLTMKCD